MTLNAATDVRLSAGTSLAVPFLDRLSPAKSAGFSGVSITLGDYDALCAAGHGHGAIRSRIADAGLVLSEFEALTNWQPVAGAAVGPWAAMAPFLARATPEVLCPVAAELGAEAVLCVEMLPTGLDIAARAEAFARTCDIAAIYGLRVVLEFLPTSGIVDLATARAIVEGAGRANGGLMFDSWHFHRSGGKVADLAALPGHLIGAIQLCDGPLAAEADLAQAMMHERLLPGDGEMPLADWLAAIRATGCTVPVAVEVFNDALAALPMDRIAARAAQSVRRLVPPLRTGGA